MSYRSRIIGTGIGLPKGIMTNNEFESFVDTTDEWIRTRTGIETRRIIDRNQGESTLSLAKLAADQALERAGLPGSELELIIVGTVTPENIMPTTANQLQSYLGAKRAFTFDMQAACSGFLYSLSVADHFIQAGTVKTALVIGAETLSTVTNWKDRSTCVLFGDGAGAAVLQRTESEDHAILASRLYSDGDYYSFLNIPHGYGKVPPWAPEYRLDMHKIQMAGSEVFKIATRNMTDSAKTLLAERSMTTNDVDFFIFHQANMRIIDYCLKALGIEKSRTWINVQKYGNTSSATLPVCLHEAIEAGAIKPGNLVLMSTFGGGLTWGSTLVRL